MKIQVITLVDCKRCNNLKQQLESNSIIFTNTNCDDNPSQCDSLESLLNIEDYPMVLITDKFDKILEILYITKVYNEIGKNKEFDGGIIGIPMYSIDNMIQYVKNRLL